MTSGSGFGQQILMKTKGRPNNAYEVRPRKDKRGVDLISDVLPFGRLWYGEPDAVGKRNRLRQGFSAPSARRGSFVRQAIAPGGEFNNENTTTGHAILKSPLSKSASI